MTSLPEEMSAYKQFNTDSSDSIGADIDAEDEDGETALSIAAKFNHKSCERHLFLFRWQERAKRTRPSTQPDRMAHQFFDSAFPVWMNGPQSQLYFTNILPPGVFEGTRLDSPKKKMRKPGALSRNGTEDSFEQPEEDEEYDEDGNMLFYCHLNFRAILSTAVNVFIFAGGKFPGIVD